MIQSHKPKQPGLTGWCGRHAQTLAIVGSLWLLAIIEWIRGRW